jgi:hypothetical protein
MQVRSYVLIHPIAGLRIGFLSNQQILAFRTVCDPEVALQERLNLTPKEAIPGVQALFKSGLLDAHIESHIE